MRPELFVEMAAVQQQHWWFTARRDILSAVIQKMRLPPQATVLEIGCGTGANLQMLAQHGMLSAMEYDPQARRMASSLNLCSVQPGGLPHDVPYADASFDLVCMLDVLEHIQDDEAALRRVLQLAKPGGRLLITVPAYQWLWSEHDTEHHHFRRYTATRLQTMARNAGWHTDRIGYFNTLLFPAVAGARLIAKLLRRPAPVGTHTPTPWLNSVLKKLFRAERNIVATHGGFPLGVSVVAVLRRPS